VLVDQFEVPWTSNLLIISSIKYTSVLIYLVEVLGGILREVVERKKTQYLNLPKGNRENKETLCATSL
jgi:hypothetical protein